MRLLKIHSLPPSRKEWVDRDTIMLHACFQLLEDCIEKEDLLVHCNYESHKELVDEAKSLYDWWQKRKKSIYSDFSKEKEIEDQEMILRLVRIREFLWT